MRKIILLLLALLCISSLVSQENLDGKNKKNLIQSLQLNDSNSWAVGAGLSNFIMHGDLRSLGTGNLGNFWNFGGYAYVDKMFNPLLGLEFKVNYSKISGGAQYFSSVYDILYVNKQKISNNLFFKGTAYGAELNFILSFSNLYVTNARKWHAAGYFGVGYHQYDSALYEKLSDGSNNLLVDFGKNPARNSVFEASSIYLSAQFGIKYRLNKRVDIEIRPSWYFNYEDHLDATISNKQNWETFFVTHVGIAIKLGKKKVFTIWGDEEKDKGEKFEIVDTDDDGVIDQLDKDPDTPVGVMVYGDGTPVDSDQDTVPDYIDKCPFVKGRVDNDGCPFIGDKDRDGIPDREDKCPEVKGLEIYQGCPDANSLRVTELVTVMSYSKNIYFNTGSNSIRSGFYYTMLDDVADIMLKNKDVTFSVHGFTDDVGPEEYNLKLSERRANEARKYLIERGVEPDRVTAKGFGELNPMYGNDTTQGKQLNRRVEIKSVGYYESKTQLKKLEDLNKN
jgi:outer membrane protein OmpA-like peptidoglycan-associated protein